MFLWVFNIFSPVSSGTAFWYNASMKKAAQQKEDFYGPHDHQGHCPAGRGLRHHRFPGAEQCAGDQLPDPGARAPGVPGTGLPLQPAGSEPSLQPDPCAGRHSAGALRPFSRLHRAAPGALRPGTGLPDHVVLRPGRGQRNRRPVRLSGKSPGGRAFCWSVPAAPRPICCGATHGGRPPCCWGMCPRPPRFSGSTLSAPTTM